MKKEIINNGEIKMFDIDLYKFETICKLRQLAYEQVTEHNLKHMEGLFKDWEVYAQSDPEVRKQSLFLELDALSEIMPEFTQHIRKQYIDVGLFKVTSDDPSGSSYMQRNYGPSKFTYIRAIHIKSEISRGSKLFSYQLPPTQDFSEFPLLNEYPAYKKELSKLYTKFFNGFTLGSLNALPLVSLHQMEADFTEDHELLSFEPFYDYYQRNKQEIDLSKIIYIGSNGAGISFYLNLNWPAREDGSISVMVVDVEEDYEEDMPYGRYNFWEFIDFMSVTLYDGGDNF